MFPLGVIPHPQIDPVLFRLGPLAVRWYGLAYLLGFALAYLVLRWLARRVTLKLSPASLSDLVAWLIVGVIFGGRAGWWFFYHHAGAVEPWYEPLAIWHGGMSFHGGLFGVAVALAVWSWARRAPFWNIADGLALVAPIGLFFGRIANFINAELVGRPTDLPWGVIFPGETIARHPSQIYEATLEGAVLLVVLWVVIIRWRPREGRVATLFLIFYGILRFAVEEPDPQLGFIAFGWLTIGQLLSAALTIAGAALWLIGPAKEAASSESRVPSEAVSAETGSNGYVVLRSRQSNYKGLAKR